MSAFTLTSPAFDHDTPLPDRFTVEGGDASPPLQWSGVPDGTKELVLVCEDRDGEEGVVTHWLVYGILPEETSELAEDLGDAALVQGEDFEFCQGLNEFDNSGWSGPNSEVVRGPHRLFFKLFALDILMDVPPGITRQELREASKDHVIASTELVGIALAD